jgi:cytochrome P450
MSIESRDILSSEHKRDPFPYYARLRAEAPVTEVSIAGLGKVWMLTRYADIAACLKDDTRYVRDPSRAGIVSPSGAAPLLTPPIEGFGPSMLNLDGHAHRRLRSAAMRAFARPAVEEWRTPIEAIAHDLLDRLSDRDQVELLSDYALPLPIAVVATVLGLPPEDRDKICVWLYTFMAGGTRTGRLPAVEAKAAFVSYMKHLFCARRAEPRADLATALALDAGGGLDEDEFVAMVHLLLFAGYETVSNLIGSGTLALIEHPSAFEALRSEPVLYRTAVDELLRFCAPVEMATARFVAEDTVLHNRLLRRGEIVFPVLASANRDAATFDEPDNLNLSRDPNPHLAFGDGAHVCLGMHLARLEAEIAFRVLFARFPDLGLAVGQDALVWRSARVIRGLAALPVRLR